MLKWGNFLVLSRPNSKLKFIGLIALGVVLASTIVFTGYAAISHIAFESENGALCGAIRIDDTTASGSKAILFNNDSQSTVNENCISGTAYYVDCISGSDSNNGASTGGAWKTLSKANSAALNPGDGVLLKNGCTFNESMTVSRSGTSAARIIIGTYGDGAAPILTRNTNGANVSVTGSYVVIRDLNLKGVAPQTDQTGGVCNGTAIGFTLGVSLESGATNVTVQNNTISGHYAGVYVKSGAHHNKVVANTLKDNKMMSTLDVANTNNDAGAFGILLHGDDNEINGNVISGSDACSYDYDRDGAAIEVYGGQRNLMIYNKASESDAFTEVGNSRSSGNTFAYNQFVSTLAKSKFLLTRGANDVFGPVSSTSVYNNVAYLTGANSQGVICYAGCSSSILTMRNNIMWADWKALYADAAFNESNNIYWKTGGNPLVQATINANSLKANPLFVANGTNLSLQSGSPALNAGSNESVTAGFVKDIAGNTVPSGTGVDIGAYEFQTTGTPPPPPPPPTTTGSVTIAAVGDMNPSGNTSTTSSSGKNAAGIIAGLNSGELDAFLGIGDFQYSTGTCSTLVSQWGRLWGAALPKTYHIAGPTHDTASATDELGYRQYFNGQCAGSTAKSAAVTNKGSSIGPFEPYSFDIGNWHFAMMSTAAIRYTSSSITSQATWLDNDLTAAKAAGKNLAVAYHDPYYTSSTSSHNRETDVKPWIDIMDKHDVRLTLSGSQHNYERSCPVLKDDTCTAESGTGMTAFQVSTGGISLRSFTNSPSYIVKRFSDTHGWLKLTLNNDGSFSWVYMPVNGPGTDSGSRVKIGG